MAIESIGFTRIQGLCLLTMSLGDWYGDGFWTAKPLLEKSIPQRNSQGNNEYNYHVQFIPMEKFYLTIPKGEEIIDGIPIQSS